MKIISILKENYPGERRVPVVPSSVEKIVKQGAQLIVEAGIGESIGVSDTAYVQAGAKIEASRRLLLEKGDIVLKLRKPVSEEIPWMRSGTLHISYLDPFHEIQLVKDLARQNVSSVSLEMIPRTTLAQKMDVLSSQANLAGYVAVILAAERLNKIFPMMMTPAGTISPARVFVIGVGVAGLQAIATAKRLGARVEAFDTRPVVEDQVKSLGAKFVKADLGETGQTKDGYAKELTAEQIAKQREAMAKHCAMADVVITTAQVFGKKAPVIVTADMTRQMKPGSVMVDLAVETGGNIEGARINEEIVTKGVTIIGLANLPARVALNASEMFSSNITSFILHYWDKDTKSFLMNVSDDILAGCLVTHQGKIVNEKLKSLYLG